MSLFTLRCARWRLGRTWPPPGCGSTTTATAPPGPAASTLTPSSLLDRPVNKYLTPKPCYRLAQFDAQILHNLLTLNVCFLNKICEPNWSSKTLLKKETNKHETQKY